MKQNIGRFTPPALKYERYIVGSTVLSRNVLDPFPWSMSPKVFTDTSTDCGSPDFGTVTLVQIISATL